jgi:capsular exopolysaccharide synthesis family protein
MRALRDDVQVKRSALAKRRADLRPLMLRKYREQSDRSSIDRRIELEQELAILDDLDRQLSREIDTLTQGNKSFTTQTLDLRSIQDDTTHKEEAALRIGAEIEALNVELEAPPRVRTIEDASIPRVRDEKGRLMTIMLAILGPFFGSIFGVAFLELQRQRVDTADEVPADLGIRVIGTLPLLPSRVSRGGGTRSGKERYWFNILHNSVDAARTMLLHAAQAGTHRLVMITSAVASEGKTSLAGYLASSLAKSGMRTLLVDADLRNPSIHRIFDLAVTPGLAELLRGEATLNAVIVETALESLSVITAGTCDQRTIRALARGELGSHFARLKDCFDFIIVDSSPILPVPDGLLVAQQADAVLLSVFCERSRKSLVKSAADRLRDLGVPILGAVVSGAHVGSYKDAYGAETAYDALPAPVAGTSDGEDR